MEVGGRGELVGDASPGDGTAFPQAVIKRASVKRAGKNRKALRDVFFSIITILLILSRVSR
jgi:O-antigen/teichoic acid export membrane protein